MAEKGGLSANFYMQIALLLSIVTCSIVGFTYLGTLIENKIDDKIAPILAKIDDLESNAKWIAENAKAIDNVTVSVNKFIEYYNRTHHTEFLRPSDITAESIREYKRRR